MMYSVFTAPWHWYHIITSSISDISTFSRQCRYVTNHLLLYVTNYYVLLPNKPVAAMFLTPFNIHTSSNTGLISHDAGTQCCDADNAMKTTPQC